MTDHPIRITVNRPDLSPEQRELAQQWADDAAKIIWRGVRSAYYKELFEMVACGSTEPMSCTEAWLLARERATYGRTASKPSSAPPSEPPPTA